MKMPPRIFIIQIIFRLTVIIWLYISNTFIALQITPRRKNGREAKQVITDTEEERSVEKQDEETWFHLSDGFAASSSPDHSKETETVSDHRQAGGQRFAEGGTDKNRTEV